jgi:2'-5' RNA ligase
LPGRVSTVRLFAALTTPAAVSSELAQWARSWLARDGVRLLPARDLHLTLAFLGDRPREELTALQTAVESFTAKAPLLAVGAPLLLPHRHPRTVGVEVGDAGGDLWDLQRDLVGALAGAGSWEPPRRRFHPHVTLARMRSGTELTQLPPPTPQLVFAPVAIELLRSHLEPSGARYETLAETGFQAG